MSVRIVDKWYQYAETGDVNHYCDGFTEKERANKPPATMTELTPWFNPAIIIEEGKEDYDGENDNYKCQACGKVASPQIIEFTIIGD